MTPTDVAAQIVSGGLLIRCTELHTIFPRYLRACIKESMRTMPILIGTMRNVPKDMVVHGYQLPKDVGSPFLSGC